MAEDNYEGLKASEREAIDFVAALLHKYGKVGDGKVVIYTWPWTRAVGIRVAEVSYTNAEGSAGSSVMQSDTVESLGICAAAERAAVARAEDWPRGEIWRADADLILYALGKKALATWQKDNPWNEGWD